MTFQMTAPGTRVEFEPGERLHGAMRWTIAWRHLTRAKQAEFAEREASLLAQFRGCKYCIGEGVDEDGVICNVCNGKGLAPRKAGR